MKDCYNCKYRLTDIEVRGRYKSPSSGYYHEEWMSWCTLKHEPVRHPCDRFEEKTIPCCSNCDNCLKMEKVREISEKNAKKLRRCIQHQHGVVIGLTNGRFCTKTNDKLEYKASHTTVCKYWEHDGKKLAPFIEVVE